MVCVRCKMAVQSVLEELQINYLHIELGKAILKENISSELVKKIEVGLSHYELELMYDKRKIVVESIKILIIELLHSSKEDEFLKLSVFLSSSLEYDYTYLSNIFSELESSTIEKFYIDNRIERVKELIVYENLNISEIAYRLRFSSISHLCFQFKKITGQTPSKFKKLVQSDLFVWKT